MAVTAFDGGFFAFDVVARLDFGDVFLAFVKAEDFDRADVQLQIIADGFYFRG